MELYETGSFKPLVMLAMDDNPSQARDLAKKVLRFLTSLVQVVAPIPSCGAKNR